MLLCIVNINKDGDYVKNGGLVNKIMENVLGKHKKIICCQ